MTGQRRRCLGTVATEVGTDAVMLLVPGVVLVIFGAAHDFRETLLSACVGASMFGGIAWFRWYRLLNRSMVCAEPVPDDAYMTRALHVALEVILKGGVAMAATLVVVVVGPIGGERVLYPVDGALGGIWLMAGTMLVLLLWKLRREERTLGRRFMRETRNWTWGDWNAARGQRTWRFYYAPLK